MSLDVFSFYVTEFAQRFVLPYTLMVLPFYVWYGLLFFLKNKCLKEDEAPKTNLPKLAFRVLLYTYVLPIVIAFIIHINNYKFLDYFSEFVDEQTSKSEMNFHLITFILSAVSSIFAVFYCILQSEEDKSFSGIKQAKGRIFTKFNLFLLLFSIPFMFILFELMSRLSVVGLLLFIGAPGAIIAFLKKG